MSKIGKKIIFIPEGVTIQETNGVLECKGKGGTLALPILKGVTSKIEGNQITFGITGDDLQTKANWGTMRALTQNAVLGVSEGFKKILEILGVGFRANMEGDELVLNIGFSHPIRFKTPAGVKITVEKNAITISGLDKYLVGQTAAKIRSIKKPEPYKGTGIRYRSEVVRKKVGKKVAGTTGTA
ncbi:MAG TPA: 50S ribosomal protein L6 [Candidatus Paceibacterota bacterium]